MKKTLLALALAGIATASFGFTVYQSDVASLTLSTSLKTEYTLNKTKNTVDSSKLTTTAPKVTTTTTKPSADVSLSKLVFAGDFNLDSYKTGFELKLKTFDDYNFKTTTKTVTKAGDTSVTTKEKSDNKYVGNLFNSLSTSPFSIYFDAPTLGKLTFGVNNGGIDLDGTDADTKGVASYIDEGDKYLVQYDSFTFFNNFTAGASLNYTYNSGVSYVGTYAGYVSYAFANDDSVKLTALDSTKYTYNTNSIRYFNSNTVAYQLAYVNSTLVDNLTLEVAYQHSKTLSYTADTQKVDADNSNNQNGAFVNANYTFNDYLNPYVSVAFLNEQALVANADCKDTISGGVGVNSTLYSGYGVTVSSNLEVNYAYTTTTPVKANEKVNTKNTDSEFNFKANLELAF